MVCLRIRDEGAIEFGDDNCRGTPSEEIDRVTIFGELAVYRDFDTSDGLLSTFTDAGGGGDFGTSVTTVG